MKKDNKSIQDFIKESYSQEVFSDEDKVIDDLEIVQRTVTFNSFFGSHSLYKYSLKDLYKDIRLAGQAILGGVHYSTANNDHIYELIYYMFRGENMDITRIVKESSKFNNLIKGKRVFLSKHYSFFFTGKPGVGKTSLCRMICNLNDRANKRDNLFIQKKKDNILKKLLAMDMGLDLEEAKKSIDKFDSMQRYVKTVFLTEDAIAAARYNCRGVEWLNALGIDVFKPDEIAVFIDDLGKSTKFIYKDVPFMDEFIYLLHFYNIFFIFNTNETVKALIDKYDGKTASRLFDKRFMIPLKNESFRSFKFP